MSGENDPEQRQQVLLFIQHVLVQAGGQASAPSIEIDENSTLQARANAAYVQDQRREMAEARGNDDTTWRDLRAALASIFEISLDRCKNVLIWRNDVHRHEAAVEVDGLTFVLVHTGIGNNEKSWPALYGKCRTCGVEGVSPRIMSLLGLGHLLQEFSFQEHHVCRTFDGDQSPAEQLLTTLRNALATSAS